MLSTAEALLPMLLDIVPMFEPRGYGLRSIVLGDQYSKAVVTFERTYGKTWFMGTLPDCTVKLTFHGDGTLVAFSWRTAQKSQCMTDIHGLFGGDMAALLDYLKSLI